MARKANTPLDERNRRALRDWRIRWAWHEYHGGGRGMPDLRSQADREAYYELTRRALDNLENLHR